MKRNAAVGLFTKLSRLKLVGYLAFLITSKILDVRRRGATSEAYGAIRRKEERSLARLGGKAIRRRRTSTADDALMVDQGQDKRIAQGLEFLYTISFIIGE